MATRGQIRCTTSDGRVFGSTEFNGSMGVKDYGRTLMPLLLNLQNDAQFFDLVHSFNDAHFGYDATQESIVSEYTKENCIPCPHGWGPCSPDKCPDYDSCCHSYYGSTKDGNVYNLAEANYHSDYLYWLNQSDEDITILAEEGPFIVAPGKVGVLNYDSALGSFSLSEWKDAEESILQAEY